uniref:Uncharacterized protein n=1 Tax=Picea glauca TaxID=3330 RepID=A0A101M3E2_PICGL|nr:hypothetical protein ABT39_MTgene12 [Picea glauca]
MFRVDHFAWATYCFTRWDNSFLCDCFPLLLILHATRYDPRGAKQDPLVQ